MDNQKKNSEIVLKATSQGFSISIYRKRGDDGSWKYAVERNEIIFPEFPDSEETDRLEMRRDYEMTGFDFDFRKAFQIFDESEWFLCHPSSLHADYVEDVIDLFYRRMEEYQEQFPADSPMERFLRENKTREWKEKADDVRAQKNSD